MSARTSATGRGVPPVNGSISGLQQPGQRSGQPWSHTAKRRPGPSASVTGIIRATLRKTLERVSTFIPLFYGGLRTRVFDELHAVAEGVAKLEPRITRNRDA